jgi:hypothetical protein
VSSYSLSLFITTFIHLFNHHKRNLELHLISNHKKMGSSFRPRCRPPLLRRNHTRGIYPLLSLFSIITPSSPRPNTIPINKGISKHLSLHNISPRHTPSSLVGVTTNKGRSQASHLTIRHRSRRNSRTCTRLRIHWRCTRHHHTANDSLRFEEEPYRKWFAQPHPCTRFRPQPLQLLRPQSRNVATHSQG